MSSSFSFFIKVFVCKHKALKVMSVFGLLHGEHFISVLDEGFVFTVGDVSMISGFGVVIS